MLKPLFVRIILAAALLLSIAPWADRVQAEAEVVNATYVVDRSDDAAVTACTAAANDCTLRGAVQNANGSAGSDTITFASGVDVTLTAGSIDLTGGSITIQGSGRGVTAINAAAGSAAFQLASSANIIRDLSIIGDGPSGGVNQAGVWITSGTGNQVLYTSIYYMGGSGVRVAQTATSSIINNNYLGAPAAANGSLDATCLYANESYGIDLTTNSNTASANTIVCNKLGGVHLANGAQNNSLRSNTIGVTTGGARLANQTAGIIVEGGASNNAIGGGTSLERNTISGNTGYGVIVRGDTTDSNIIANSYIGLGPTGTLSISNTLGGVSIEQQAAQNVVQYNVISGNGGPGVQVLGTGVVGVTDTYWNKIYSNTIGLNVNASAVPNTVGVYVYNVGLFTEIGGHDAGGLIPNTGNVIAGNTYYGVHLYNAYSVDVAGNRIGLTRDSSPRANQSDGVRVEGSEGAGTEIISNTIRFNGGSGVRLTLFSTSTDITGNTIDSNTLDGVQIDNGSHSNQIGTGSGLSGPGYNYIGSNKRYGIQLSGSTVTTNTIQNSRIADNTLDGVALLNNTSGNVLYGNSITANNRYGVQLASGANRNRIELTLVRGNTSHGILLTGTLTTRNVITATGSDGNGGDGVSQAAGLAGNNWSRLTGGGNGGLLVDVNANEAGTNAVTQAYPIIQTVKRTGNQVYIAGRTLPVLIGFAATIEIYTPYGDPQQPGGGASIYQGPTLANLDGTFAVTLTTTANCFTAHQTVLFFTDGSSTSGEYGPTSCQLSLPLIQR